MLLHILDFPKTALHKLQCDLIDPPEELNVMHRPAYTKLTAILYRSLRSRWQELVSGLDSDSLVVASCRFARFLWPGIQTLNPQATGPLWTTSSQSCPSITVFLAASPIYIYIYITIYKLALGYSLNLSTADSIKQTNTQC